MSLRKRHGLSTILSWLFAGLAGALESLYGRSEYLGDWISYLNVSRAVPRFDWKAIFDPMWSPGYPALVAAIRALFPQTAEGEWYAICLLNWLIFLCAYAAWRHLLRRALEFYDPALAGLRDHPAVVWMTCCIFLGCSLGLDQVSSVSPDLLVTLLFVFATAQTLSILTRPTIKHAVLLGLALGVGYWVKAVFLSFAAIFFLTLICASLARKLSWRPLLTAFAVYLALAIPYSAAISWSYGQFTLGASGPLNYAFHVNQLPHWTNWQGGPPESGYPIHPTRQLLPDLPVFEFGTPFRTTYPPFNNLAYWYQGYRHFFSLRRQVVAIGRSFDFLGRIATRHPFLWGLVAIWLAVAVKGDWRKSMMRSVRRLWPLFLPPVLGIMTYLLVHIEDRYLSPLVLILSLVAMTPLLDPKLKSARLLTFLLLAGYTLTAAAELTVNMGGAIEAAIHRSDFHENPQWKLAAALSSYGLKSDDPVALIGTAEMNLRRSSWAYLDHLRIVAEFGSLPWRVYLPERTRFEPRMSEPADQNFGRVFWQMPQEQRARVITAFCGAGVKAIVSLSVPQSATDAAWKQGWRPLQGASAWVRGCGSPALAPRAP